MAQIFTYFILFSLFLSTFSHEMKWGSCPKIDVVKDFDYQKMVGVWYVIEKTKSGSTCTTYEFIQYTDGKKSLKESSRPLGIKIKDIMERFTQEGDLRTPSPAFPAKMRVAFPFSFVPFSEVDFWIVDTDYSTYAATFSCRSLAVGHRQSAMILSRNETLDRDTINKLRDNFNYYGINKHSLSIIDQNKCDHPKTLDPSDLEPENNKDGGEEKTNLTPTKTLVETQTQTHTQTETETQTQTQTETQVVIETVTATTTLPAPTTPEVDEAEDNEISDSK